MKAIHIVMVSVVLSLLGLSLFFYKAYHLEFPLKPNKEAQSWYIEAKIAFTPSPDKPAQVSFFIPQNTSNYAIVDESFISQAYGQATKRDKLTGNRMVTWSKRQVKDHQVLFYRAVLYELSATGVDDGADGKVPEAVSVYKKGQKPAVVQPAAEGEPAMDDVSEESPVFLAIHSVIDEAKERSVDTNSFVTEIYKSLERRDDDRIKLIIRNAEKGLDTTPRLAVLLLNAANIPARIVNGVSLEGQRRFASIVEWVEVYVDKQWHSIDPKSGRFGLDGQYFPWWRGAMPVLRVNGGKNIEMSISVKQNTEDAITKAIWKGQNAAEIISELSLFSLPIDTQLVFKVLLLVPVGGLVISFLRQIVGIKTFGTFMPVLVALSFRETQLFWGVFLFTTVVVIGLIIRAYFDKLQLLFVPRLTAVLTIVVLLIGLLTVVLYKFGINAGLSISLFPMIILTMTIERMSVMWEEVGPKESISTGVGSLACAIIAYLCMSSQYIGHLVFVFPELLFLVLSISILMGRYNGYKLTEYWRFRTLERNIRNGKA